jgi:1-acyl-sn-glycerol-3-phosphate acyltransferase
MRLILLSPAFLPAGPNASHVPTQKSNCLYTGFFAQGDCALPAIENKTATVRRKNFIAEFFYTGNIMILYAVPFISAYCRLKICSPVLLKKIPVHLSIVNKTVLLYRLLKFPAKLALLIWCRHLKINRRDILSAEGPLLIAANHPNSFLDAILLCTLFKHDIYSLARGDAFKSKFNDRLLRALNMFPVYRLSEGAENLEHNYTTFGNCIEIFKKNGIVLIFSEGRCINEWHLRPLKKGTARLVMDAWEQGIPLKIIPTGINYSSFSRFGKNIELNFGEYICQDNAPFKEDDPYGTKILAFNTALKAQLEKLVIKINPVDKNIVKQKFEVPVSAIKRILLFLPAWLGYLLHLPLYFPIQRFTQKKFADGHYDSVIVGLCFLLYPFYLALTAVLIWILFGNYWWLFAFIIMPFLAWCRVSIKKQI